MSLSKDQVVERLRRVKGPDMQGNIVDLGLVSEILLKDGRVSFSITVPAERASELEPLRQAAEKVVRDIDGRTVMDLEKADASRLLATGWKPPMPFTVKARDGTTDLYGLMFTPTKLDEIASAFEAAEAIGRASRPLAFPAAKEVARLKPKLPGRNDLCVCGSMRKWKQCCGAAA